MIFTNVHNLPSPLVRALLTEDYYQPGHVSVTGLIRPPRIRVLEARHSHEIEVDVSERLWSLMGRAVHYVLERAAAPGEIREIRLTEEVLGWKVTGKPDLYLPKERFLLDFKFTSLWATREGAKPEWKFQLNAYAWMLRKKGLGVEKAAVVAVYRDFSLAKARRDPSLPQAGAELVPVRLWENEEVERWIVERVRLHQEAEKLPDEELPVCTPEERWARPDQWAVKKKGRKRAERLFSSLEEAEEYLAKRKDKDYEIERRPGRNVRCEDFCPVREFCNVAS